MNFETRDQSKWWPSSGFLNIFFVTSAEDACPSSIYLPFLRLQRRFNLPNQIAQHTQCLRG